jgi:hypothetical protein
VNRFKPKQDEAPLGAKDDYNRPSFMEGTDSPPSCSLTASPERTTEKKLTSIKQKMAATSVRKNLNFQC